jgi:thiopeptide-type bacteriocin biosynthesis protein
LSRDDRWRVALCGIDSLASDLGVDGAARQRLFARCREAYLGEHRPSPGLGRRIGERLRTERALLDALLTGDDTSAPSAVRVALEALRRRSERIAPITAALRELEASGRLTPLEQIVPSFTHMFAIRLLRFAARDQELVLNDLLSRLYESRAAREAQLRSRALPESISARSSR